MEFERTSVLLGGGQSGVRWAEQNNSRMLVLDSNPYLNSSALKIARADTLAIPLPNRSVSLMYADFLLNSVYLPGMKASDVIRNPEILMDPRTPQLIRDWYESNGRPRDLGSELRQVRWLTRHVALSEMLRVLMPGGQLVIMDHRHVIQWVIGSVKELSDIFNCTSSITYDDFIRSASLRKLMGKTPPPPIEKVHLLKSNS